MTDYPHQYPEMFSDDRLEDSPLAYEMGYISADELFDQDPEDTDATNPEDIKVLTEWDMAFEARTKDINPDTSFIDSDEWAELCSVVQDGLEAKRQLGSADQEKRSELQKRVVEAQTAREKMFVSNLRLAAWFTRESMGFHKNAKFASGNPPIKSNIMPGFIHDYAGAPLDYADRLQVVMTSLYSSIDKHDPTRGKFSTYAMYNMERSLQGEIDTASQNYITRIPVHAHILFRKVRRSVAVAHSEGRLPNLDETVFESQTSHAKVEQTAAQMVLLRSGPTIEQVDGALLSAAMTMEEIPEVLSVADQVRAANDLTMFHELEDDMVTDEMLTIFEKLDDRERDLFDLRFSLTHGVPLTLEEVGKAMGGLSRERVRQIESRALAKFRSYAIARGLFSHNSADYKRQEDGYVLSGVREGVFLNGPIKVNSEEVPRFDKVPSDKYKLRTTKPKFIYQEDWTD